MKQSFYFVYILISFILFAKSLHTNLSLNKREKDCVRIILTQRHKAQYKK